MSVRSEQQAKAEGSAWLSAMGLALVLFSLLRWSINNTWDAWCTAGAVLGVVGLGTWAVRRRGGWRSDSRGSQYGRQAAASSLLLLAVLVLLNFIATRHNRSFDLTEGGLFTLSGETRQVLRGLPFDVRLLAFFPSGRRAQSADLLQRYAEASPRLHYELIDPDQEPERAQRYGVTAYGTVVVEKQAAGLAQPGSSGTPVRVEAEPAQSKAPLRLSEEKLTNALLKVTRGGQKTVYFLEGHGEADIASPERNGYAGIRHFLEGQAFQVKRLSLAKERDVPGDCAVLIIAGPSAPPHSAEIQAVERYLQRGGKAFVMVDPAPGTGLDAFLDHWGVKVSGDLVIDASGAGRLYGAGPAVPLVKDYDGRHPITRGFRLNTFFPLARSLTPKDNPGDAAVWPLAQTSADSFAEPYAGGRRRAAFDRQTDRKGPLLLAVAVTREAKAGKQARLVVVGDSDFISNAFFSQAGNGDFFLAAVNWLAEEEELIAIQPRPQQDRRVQLTDQQARGVFWLMVIGMPGMALALGVGVHWRRRV